jgi:hypothetical protein
MGTKCQVASDFTIGERGIGEGFQEDRPDWLEISKIYKNSVL